MRRHVGKEKGSGEQSHDNKATTDHDVAACESKPKHIVPLAQVTKKRIAGGGYEFEIRGLNGQSNTLLLWVAMGFLSSVYPVLRALDSGVAIDFSDTGKMYPTCALLMVVSLFMFIAGVKTATTVERIILAPRLGIQLEQSSLFSRNRQLIPVETLSGVYINEVVWRYTIKNCLIAVIHDEGHKRIVATTPLITCHTVPLESLVEIYNAAYDIFPDKTE
eukprot:m.79431 g.79431  ORF g.79431 m.79431 type:complete len:219 (-) comp25215_c0_seq1:246-902(-)